MIRSWAKYLKSIVHVAQTHHVASVDAHGNTHNILNIILVVLLVMSVGYSIKYQLIMTTDVVV